jgi:hypothetical protein
MEVRRPRRGSEDGTIPTLAVELEQGFRHTLELDPADGIELLTLLIAGLDCREGFKGK